MQMHFFLPHSLLRRLYHRHVLPTVAILFSLPVLYTRFPYPHPVYVAGAPLATHHFPLAPSPPTPPTPPFPALVSAHAHLHTVSFHKTMLLPIRTGPVCDEAAHLY